MKQPSAFIFLCLALLSACKNNGNSTSTISKVATESNSKLNTISVKTDVETIASEKLDFQILRWEAMNDTLLVEVRYTGGCAEHKFHASFSGGWLKSMPPAVLINIEHIVSKEDPCRQMIKDTLLFDLTTVRYASSKEVNVKSASDPSKSTRYAYGN
jgi:hypothetical protein